MNREATGVVVRDGEKWLTTLGATAPSLASTGDFGEITIARVPAEVPEDARHLLRDAFGAAQIAQAALTSRLDSPLPIIADRIQAPRRTPGKGRFRAFGDDRDLMLDALAPGRGPFVARCFGDRRGKVSVPSHFRLDVSPFLIDKDDRRIHHRGRRWADEDIPRLLLERPHPALEEDVVRVECLDPSDQLLVFRQSLWIKRGSLHVPVSLCLFEGVDTPPAWALTNIEVPRRTPASSRCSRSPCTRSRRPRRRARPPPAASATRATARCSSSTSTTTSSTRGTSA
jgi:hypothetical protein